MIEVAVGFLLGVWFLTVAGVAYAIWRYAFVPFTVVRRDVAALAAKHAELEKRAGEMFDQMRRRAAAMSEAELASVERRLRAESRQRAAHAERGE